jgi:arylsulfatase A-like enzyme
LFKGGETITKMVQNIDVAPTILECAGLQKPEYMPGKSIVQLLKGDTTQWRNKIFYEYYWEYDFPMTPTMFGIRTDRFKYIHYQGIWDTNELYDIQNDPDETTNLIAQPEYQDTVKQLADELWNWLQTTNGMQIPLKKTLRHPSGDYRHPLQY